MPYVRSKGHWRSDRNGWTKLGIGRLSWRFNHSYIVWYFGDICTAGEIWDAARRMGVDYHAACRYSVRVAQALAGGV